MRMPISLVRSVTDTSMMFMMPMPPTMSETPAIAARRAVRVWAVCEAVWMICDWFITSKSSSAPAASLCDSRRMLVDLGLGRGHQVLAHRAHLDRS